MGDMTETAASSDVNPGSFACPCCGKTSHHPQDVEQRYCGACHWWTGAPALGEAHLQGPCDARSEERGCDEKAAVDALIHMLEGYVADHTPPFSGGLPNGIRLEMHPEVYYMIMRSWMPGYQAFVANSEGPFPAQIPVKVNPEMPLRYWRLVVVTEDVINGGVMPVPALPR